MINTILLVTKADIHPPLRITDNNFYIAIGILFAVAIIGVYFEYKMNKTDVKLKKQIEDLEQKISSLLNG
jgi:hypothetical protein